MPLGIVSEDEFEREVRRYRNDKMPSALDDKVIPTVDNGESNVSCPNDSFPEYPLQPLIEEKTLEGTVEGKIVQIQRGRGKGNNEVPESLRALLGITSVAEGRRDALDIARELGISPASVSAYANGATSTTTYNRPDGLLKEKVDIVRTDIIKKAQTRLSTSLDNITEDKLSEASLKELAIVGKSLSGIIKDLEPDKANDNGNAPQVVIYAPQVKQENYYETLELRE